MASTSLILARNWFPSPSPLLAPLTRPAMSTNSIDVGITFCGFTSSSRILSLLIRDRDHANIRLDGTKRKVSGLGLIIGNSIK